MRALISSRLVSRCAFRRAALASLRERGFPQLELRGEDLPGGLHRPGAVEGAARALRDAGLSAPWLRLSAEDLAALDRPGGTRVLADALHELRATQLVVPFRARPPLPPEELQSAAALGGARLCLEVRPHDGLVRQPERLERVPTGLGLVLVLDEPRELPAELPHAVLGRLEGVRLGAPGPSGGFGPPGGAEARALPRLLQGRAGLPFSYELDDPSGFCAEAALAEVLERVRDFHQGAFAPRDEHGGIFWGGLPAG